MEAEASKIDEEKLRVFESYLFIILLGYWSKK